MDVILAEVRPGPQELISGIVRAVKGWLHVRSGDPEAGVRCARRGLDDLYAHPFAEVFVTRLGNLVVPVVASLLARTAEAAAAEPPADPATALRRARHGAVLLGAANSLRPTARAPLERAELAAAEPLLRAALGDREYAAAYAEGDGLSTEDAVALAREACA